MERRKEILRVDEPEHMTIAQLKLKLREARVSERDIALCIERSQLNTLYMERLDTEFKSAVLVQRHWRSLQEWRKARATRERLQRQGAHDGAEDGQVDRGTAKKDDVFGKLSNREIEFYQEVFERIDGDGSGEIDGEELKIALTELGQEADDEVVADMVAEAGKGGVVDFAGFLKLVTSDRMDLSKNAKAMMSKAKIKKYQRAFHEFDEDNSGEIDCVELQKVFNALGQTPTEAEVKAMIDEVDADGSGTIGFDEFLTLMTHPDRALAQAFADRMDALNAEVGANVAILKMWRFMSAQLNPALGQPRLVDPKLVLRVRAGCVPVRTVVVPKTYIENRAAADSNDVIPVELSVDCTEVQVLLVSSLTYPSLWVLPSGVQRIPRACDGVIDWDVQSPEDAAIQHAADEAGCEGEIASFLGPIEDHWKNTITRWFHLDKVAFEDDYKRPLPCWTEKDLRSRKWFPLISEEVVQSGLLPPHGKRGTTYTVIGPAAEQLLWRRPLHQAVQAYVDGFATFGEPLMISVRRNWDGRACSPSHRAKAWCCLDSGSGSLVLGFEATYSDDSRPRVGAGPCINLDSYESVAFYLASQAPHGSVRSDADVDDIEYVQIVVGPHGHYMVQKLQGNRKVLLSCLSHDELMTQEWYTALLPRQRDPLRADIKLCKTAISYDKSKWTGVIVVPQPFVPPGPRYCGNFYSMFGPESGRKYLATFPVPGYRERFRHQMHQDVVGDRIHPDMHAFIAFHLLNVPSLPHLCNWNPDEGMLLQTVGEKTVKEHREKLRQQQEADPRASDAGWDTLGQYWDNLSRRTDRLALRTPSYPGIKSQSIPWKDNSRPPTRIREKAVPGGAQNQMSKHAFKHVQPDSDPWQHPGASSPFAKVKDQINQGEASPQTQSPARSPATSPLKTKSPLRQGTGPTQEQTAEDRTKLGL